MSISKTLLGATRLVPETGETGWGSETTQILVDLIDSNNINVQKLAAGGLVRVIPATTATPAAASTLTPTSSYMRISGSGGAVTLNTTTPITAGEFDGQELDLEGTSDANTVTIEASGNTKFNGDIVLVDGTFIKLRWNNTASEWRELSRNN